MFLKNSSIFVGQCFVTVEDNIQQPSEQNAPESDQSTVQEIDPITTNQIEITILDNLNRVMSIKN